jgi:hypothetical protein
MSLISVNYPIRGNRISQSFLNLTAISKVLVNVNVASGRITLMRRLPGVKIFPSNVGNVSRIAI